MFIWFLCMSLDGEPMRCEPYQYKTVQQCEADGRFRAVMYERWIPFEWECKREALV